MGCLVAGAACMGMLAQRGAYPPCTPPLPSTPLPSSPRVVYDRAAWLALAQPSGQGTSRSSAQPHPTQPLMPLDTCAPHSTTVPLGPTAPHNRGFGEEWGGRKAASLDVCHVRLQASKIRVLHHSAVWVSTSALVLCVKMELLSRMGKY